MRTPCDPIRATSRRVVATTGISSEIRTDSCFSRGRTSLNQPTTPAREIIAPSTEIDALVTNPAKSSVRPNANTIGDEVGAGISIVFGDSVLITSTPLQLSTSDDIHDRKDNDPNGVDEVPIKRQNADRFSVLPPDVSKHGKECHSCQGNKAHGHVKRMQTDE